MAEKRSNESLSGGLPAPRRDDLAGLLRSWWVRTVLAATATFSVFGAVGSGGGLTEKPTAYAFVEPAIAETRVVPLESVPETVGEAWRRRAVERESQRLAAEYVQRGYRVSPQLAFDIHDAALRHDIKPEMAFGLVRAESSFRNSATSHVGATGLTQLMPRTAAWIEPGTTRADLRDQKRNLDIGFKYLRYLLDKYDGDERLALLAYNRGPGTVDRVLRRGGNPDNGYVEMVLGKRTSKRR